MKQATAGNRKSNQNLAETLVELGLRVPQVEHITGVSRSLVRAFYEKHHQRRSPSGLMPQSLTWYTESQEVSVHSAFFLLLFQHHYANLKRSRAAAQHSALTTHAYCRALSSYQIMCGTEEPIIGPERALRLVQHFADRLVLARNVPGDDTIKLIQCGSCATHLIVAAQYRVFTCGECKDARNAKKMH
jgi:hypothetical protein